MDVTQTVQTRTRLTPYAASIASIGAALALAATYWDDSWHTDRGRDEFAIPPHLLLYSAVLSSSLVVVAWAVGAWRAAPRDRIRALLGDPALVLAGIGGITTLASAPIDDWWHRSYGRDAVLWSPPHLLAVTGTLALSIGILAGLTRVPGPRADAARVLAAAGVFGVLQVPVLEYDTDVAQFSTIWFLPVASLGVCMALTLVEDLFPGRWRPTQAALTATALRIAITVVLTAAGFSPAGIPPILLPVLLGALLHQVHRVLRLMLVGAASPLVWWPFLVAQGSVVTQVPARQLAASVALGAAAGILVAVIHGDLSAGAFRGRHRPAIVAATVVLILIGGGAGRAAAHDPGQGQEVTTGRFVVDRSSAQADVALRIDAPCDDISAVRTVARRAGVERTGSLSIVERNAGSCRAVGRIDRLAPGRWFVYTELADGGSGHLEAWLPVGTSDRVTEMRAIYRVPEPPSSRTRTVVGGAILAAVIGIGATTLRLSKRSRRLPS